MEDIFEKLNNILSTPEGQQQLESIKNMLSSSGSPLAGQAPAQAPASPTAGLDFSALSSLLGGLGGNQPPAASQADSPPSAPPSGFDPSMLSALLGGLGGMQGNAPAGGASDSGGINPAALSSLLGGLGGGNGGTAPVIPPIDMNTIIKLQQVFSMMNANDKTTSLLMSLKPHFSEKRQEKVDKAASMLRLLAMLPAIQQSGLFAGL